MEYISHRVNTREELQKLPQEFGVEIDIRDGLNGRIYIEHDPFKAGEDFEEYLKNYKHGKMILHIKSERIEYKAIELLEKYNIKNYIFLDCTITMIKLLTDKGIKNIALEFSDLGGLDTLYTMQGKAEWVWVDSFDQLPLNKECFEKIKSLGYKICLASPELYGRFEEVEEYARKIKEEDIHIDGICTKEYNLDKWKNLTKHVLL